MTAQQIDDNIKEQKARMIKDLKGKVIEDVYREEDRHGSSWVMEFKGGSEICFRFMSEIIGK